MAGFENMDILDADLDDIETLPGFKVFHSGAVLATLQKFEAKKIGDHPAVSFSFRFDGEVQWDEEEDASNPYPKEGDIMDIAFMVDNEVGAGKMKAMLEPYKVKFGGAKVREICQNAVNIQVMIAGTREQAKDKDTKKLVPGKYYYRVNNLMIV